MPRHGRWIAQNRQDKFGRLPLCDAEVSVLQKNTAPSQPLTGAGFPYNLVLARPPLTNTA